jgi:hypothetical protein
MGATGKAFSATNVDDSEAKDWILRAGLFRCASCRRGRHHTGGTGRQKEAKWQWDNGIAL